MRKLEAIVKEIVDEMGYLKSREERFSDTNRTCIFRTNIVIYLIAVSTVSTHQRVQKFAWLTIFALTGLGVWQILHLRAYFKRKYLID